MEAFLSELYVYLVDEMHVGLNKVLSIEDQRPTPPPLTNLAQLKHFAREAEVNGHLELAGRFYQEVNAAFLSLLSSGQTPIGPNALPLINQSLTKTSQWFFQTSREYQ